MQSDCKSAGARHVLQPHLERRLQSGELAEPFNALTRKALTRLNKLVGEGAVLCLCEDAAPLAENIDAVPVGVI